MLREIKGDTSEMSKNQKIIKALNPSKEDSEQGCVSRGRIFFAPTGSNIKGSGLCLAPSLLGHFYL